MGTSYLAISYKCNHNCICCPLTTYDRLHDLLSFDEIKERVKLIKKHDENPHIVLSGGEPMMHKDYIKIVEYLADKGFGITTLSNSSICKNKEFVKELVSVIPKNKFDVITAIHSSTPAVHDKVTGTPGSLIETLTGLDNLLANNIPITIKHIFNKITLPTLMDTFKYLETHFPPNVNFQFCTMDYSGRAGKNKAELFATNSEIQAAVEPVLDYLEEVSSVKRNISFIETPLCLTDPYYWKYYAFNYGVLDTYIAPNTDEENAYYDVISECGAFFEPCRDCAVKKHCSGMWKSAYELGAADMLHTVII